MFRIVVLVPKNDLFGPENFSPPPKLAFLIKQTSVTISLTDLMNVM